MHAARIKLHERRAIKTSPTANPRSRLPSNMHLHDSFATILFLDRNTGKSPVARAPPRVWQIVRPTRYRYDRLSIPMILYVRRWYDGLVEASHAFDGLALSRLAFPTGRAPAL
ncbi:hypothetical protein TWF569_009353 [Orbilia oligospora]|uniref:Uncharacterized protein n=1 Tax=Orbilia oligospora TaxID=2813651 RepID=A0A7C8N6B7_ORBOL|nr:hypothetical protein TWF102_011600 [Orbilia oligospora]KAF3094638.1 hypothetical protein TWF706_008474 [Orbilia oligospora]KAF3096459.1 hypothetical protein TWF103_009796 [Orbilia oligospora]KAF3137074.1 hypothetical protein TWF569_009353 [Orbilia oligospora]